VKWLKSKNIDYRDAQDGLDGVRIFQTGGPFECVACKYLLVTTFDCFNSSVILLDMSMPNLDGIGATRQIRAFEQESRAAANREHYHTTRILALTGMSSLDDKRRAFDAGVDG
jgi:CheY-like chemotaxis protein